MRSACCSSPRSFLSNSGLTPAARGNVYLEKGDTTLALASYREALTKDSTMAQARLRIRQLTGGVSKRP